MAVLAVRQGDPGTIWEQWDARWYTGIAQHGYHFTIQGKPALAFFPLVPLLIRGMMHTGIGADSAGILISNAAFLAALFYLYSLARTEWGGRVAGRTTWLLAFFPTAFFTFAPYSESVFLLAAVAALYHARRGSAFVAGLWCAAAVLDRSTGFILILPLVLALYTHGIRARLAVIVPPVMAFAGYAVYLSLEHLPVHALLTAQSAWHRALTFPWVGFTASAAWLIHSGTSSVPWMIENVLQLAVTILFLGLTVSAWGVLSVPARAYCAGFWLLVLLSPEWLDGYYAPFSSMDRFVLVLVPLAGWAARVLTPRWYPRVLVGFSALMLGSTAVFLTGGWVG